MIMRIEWIEKHLNEAEQLICNKDVEQGLRLLSNLLYEEPGYGSLHNHLGWAYLYYTADLAKAEMHLKLAVKFDLDFAAPCQHLGALYMQLGRYSEALVAFEQGLQRPMANKVALLEGMAQAYELRNEYTKAIEYYKRALVSTLGAESYALNEGIKRCRKKRLSYFFTF
jgi:tetratricopeptide (TPR) repeat protein